MKLVKRATVGQAVKADVTGTGDWVSGKITEFDKTHITFQPYDGSEVVKVIRGEVYKNEVPLKSAMEAEAKVETKAKPEIGEYSHCPHCDIHLSNGVRDNEQDWEEYLSGNGPISRDDKVRAPDYENEMLETSQQYHCLACGEDFGPLIRLELPKKGSKTIKTGDYNYTPCVAASGRASKDNDDMVAQKLRGQDLRLVYKIVAAEIEVSVTELKAKYGHLNPGQQRMCLGNRLRGHYKNSES